MRRLRSRWILLFGLSIWLGVLSANAATRIWTGALNTNWAAARNWSNNVLPKAGDDLIFPLTPPGRQLWNQLALGFGSIRFLGPYTVGGSPLVADQISSEGSVTINSPLNLRPNAVADFWEALIKGTVALSGDVTFAGHGNRTVTSLYGQVTGPGRLLVKEDVALGSSNSYTGGTIILTNGVLLLDPNGFSIATLGHTDAPVEIHRGGCLMLGGASAIAQPIFAEGAGNAVNGAIQATAPEAKLLRPITPLSDAEVWNGARLWVAGSARNPDRPQATLIKKGLGPLRLLSVTNQFASRLLLGGGNFSILDGLPRIQRVHPPVAVTFLENLQIGDPTDTFGFASCDLTLRILDSNDAPVASSVFAPNVAVTVHAHSRLTLGPYQKGLGNPLRLFGGSVSLTEVYDQIPAAEHSGEIEVGGPVQSTIQGWLNIAGEVTVRSVDGAEIRIDSQLSGGRLTVQGATVSLRGTQQANEYDALNVASGSVVLGNLWVAAGGSTNIVGVDNPSAAPAFLGTSVSRQFPFPCRIEVRASGSFSNILEASLGNLLVAGGFAELAKSSASNLELRAGARLRFRAMPAPTSSLAVTRGFVWDGSASAEVFFPEGQSPDSPIRLLTRSGNEPIPGRFVGLPEGGTLTNQGAIYRINYAGGTGNDLVLEPLAAGPPPQLALTFSPDGQATFSWPEASGCRLEVQWLLDPPGAWTALVTPPPVDGQYRFLLNVPVDQATGFYRLNCP